MTWTDTTYSYPKTSDGVYDRVGYLVKAENGIPEDENDPSLGGQDGEASNLVVVDLVTGEITGNPTGPFIIGSSEIGGNDVIA